MPFSAVFCYSLHKLQHIQQPPRSLHTQPPAVIPNNPAKCIVFTNPPWPWPFNLGWPPTVPWCFTTRRDPVTSDDPRPSHCVSQTRHDPDPMTSDDPRPSHGVSQTRRDPDPMTSDDLNRPHGVSQTHSVLLKYYLFNNQFPRIATDIDALYLVVKHGTIVSTVSITYFSNDLITHI